MSETLTASVFKDEFNLQPLADATAEAMLMGAIRLLNTFGAGLTQMTGSAGSRTGTYPSGYIGAITAVSQQIYAKHYINPEGNTSSNVGQLSNSYMVDMTLLDFAEKLARKCSGMGFRRA